MPPVPTMPAAPAPRHTYRTALLWVLFAAFVVAGVARYWNTDAEDLASSYVGCRLIATGHTGELFSFDPEDFAGIGDAPAWKRLARQGDVHTYLHPYVQTPLWGYSLQPLCNQLRFPVFARIFCIAMMLCFALSIWLLARFWAPHLLRPLPIALTLVLFSLCEPFLYAMFLMQTHALFFLLSLGALMLAERERPILGGVLLALAAAVKITPGFLLVYWLFTRRWKAAASTVLTSALLVALTVLAVGPQLFTVYLADLHRISRILLVAQNNQSFAAWVMGRLYSPDEIFDINILPLPTAVRLGSTALLVATIALGGWLDRRHAAGQEPDGTPVPVGATMGLVAVTIFAPIAWTHYFFILIAPVFVLLELHARSRARWLLVPVVIIAALNFRPLSTDVLRMDVGDFAVVRGQFYAGVVALAALGAAAWRGRVLELARVRPGVRVSPGAALPDA